MKKPEETKKPEELHIWGSSGSSTVLLQLWSRSHTEPLQKGLNIDHRVDKYSCHAKIKVHLSFLEKSNFLKFD
jgi:hypothetical protein